MPATAHLNCREGFLRPPAVDAIATSQQKQGVGVLRHRKIAFLNLRHAVMESLHHLWRSPSLAEKEAWGGRA